MKFLLLALWITLIEGAVATTRSYVFNAEWLWANPDGVKARPVISFNGSWPLPIIEADQGDKIELTLINSLVNTSTSLHFHGIFQNRTAHMDGAEGVSQCPIPAGQSLTYKFTLQQPGTYWYHSHTGGQYSDGLRGMFIVHNKEIESNYKFDEELHFTVCDWYHKDAITLQHEQLTRYNPTGAEPIPQNLLFNDTRNFTIQVEPDKTYLLRIANMGVMVSQYIFFEDHDVEIIEADGVYMKPAPTKVLYMTVGQRISVLLHTKKTASRNFAIVQSMDTEMLDVIPDDLEVTAINTLQYDKSFGPPKVKDSFYDVDPADAFEEFDLRPLDESPLLPDADQVIRLTLHMDNLGDGVNYAFFNEHTFVAAKVPTILTALSAPDEYVMDSRIYGSNTNTFLLNAGDVVDIVIDNEDSNKHPLHLHGHKYQIVSKSPAYDDIHHFDYANASFPEYPCMRDTATVNTFGNLVLRFVADNPGAWFFHCHLDFHLEQGLAIVLMEAPDHLRDFVDYNSLPKDLLQICEAGGMATAGNAAGNTRDWLDLSNEPVQADPLPEGFTTKGYIALAVCIVSALWGLYEIVVFGIADINNSYEDRVEHEKQVMAGLIACLNKEKASGKGTARRRREVNTLLNELTSLNADFGSIA